MIQGGVRARDVYRYGLFALLLVVLLALLVWPIVLTVYGGFVDPEGHFSLAYLAGIFRDPLLMEGLWNSLKLAFCTTLVCVLVSLPLAILSARYDFPGKAIVTSIVLVPLILPPFVGAIGL